VNVHTYEKFALICEHAAQPLIKSQSSAIDIEINLWAACLIYPFALDGVSAASRPICIYGSANITVGQMYKMLFMKHKKITNRSVFSASKSKRLLCQR